MKKESAYDAGVAFLEVASVEDWLYSLDQEYLDLFRYYFGSKSLCRFWLYGGGVSNS